MKTPIRVGVGGTKKTKNRSGQKGSHDNANPRKIHEKNEKSEWSKRKPRRRRCTKNPRKKRKKSESSKRKPLPGGAFKKRNNAGQNYGLHKDGPPIGRKINATNPGPRKILKETKKTKIFRGPRKIHEKSQITSRKPTKNKNSC